MRERPMPVFLTEQDVRAVLTYDELIPAIRQALIDLSAGRVEQPPRTILRAGNAGGFSNGWFAIMPVLAGDCMAVKTVTFYPSNAELGLPTHMAMIELLRRATGEPLALMDGRLITEMRTAAVSAVAFAAIAPIHFAAPPTSLGILGSGVQAHAHIQAFRHVWPELADIRIWSRTAAHARRLAAETDARTASIVEAAAAEVVLTVTASPGPVLRGQWLKPNALVFAIGATGSSLRELNDEAIQSSFVIADSRTAVENESGDVRLSGVSIAAEIGQLLAGIGGDSVPRHHRIVFKSVGLAIEDLTAARLVWQTHRQSRAHC